MFGVPSFGQNPFGSVPVFSDFVPCPPSPSVIVAVAATLQTGAALLNNPLKVTPTLPKTDFI